MNHGNDVTGVLAWGLRKYAWVVALFIVGLGIVIPATLQQAPKQFEAEAQVGPVRQMRLANLDVLPRMATKVFKNVPDSDEVKLAAGLTAGETLSAEELELVADQDNIIFTVVARSSSPEVAQDTANVAAAGFAQEMNVFSQPVGSFAVTRLASKPTDPVPTLAGPVAWGLGTAAGLFAGVGAVGLILLLRRPVIDVAAAAEVSGTTALGRITLGRQGASATGLTQLCHRIVSQPTRLVLMVGPRNTRRERRDLAGELATWLNRVRRVVYMGSREPVDEYGSASLAAFSDDDQLIIIDDASPVEVATRPDESLTLLVVREGISSAALREQVQQYLDGEGAAVVLLRRAPWSSQLRHGKHGRPGMPSRFTRGHKAQPGPQDHRSMSKFPADPT